MAEPQNLYDDPEFFAGYARLARFGEGWTDAYEHEAFKSLLPDMTGLRALDLGCGAGQWALHLAESGAAEVVGVDLSERMLALARSERSHPRISYVRASLEDVTFEASRFDLVISSLAFHYVEDFADLARRITSWLAPGGRLVFSTEHPVYLSRATGEGWAGTEEGAPWLLDRYGEEGLREEEWIVPGVRKYHRMVSTILNTLIEAGLTVERVLEPMPDEAMLRRHSEWARERHRPFILLVRARRGKDAR